MTRKKQSLKFPMRLIIFDVIGTAALGLGLVKIFAGTDVIPVNMRFENYGLALVLLGVLLIVPMLSHILTWVQEQSKHSDKN